MAYSSPREARAALRRRYNEDRWLGQPYYVILIVEKDTMEPVCQPMARRWQMPFASSRGYGSLQMLRHACGFKLANQGVDTRALQHYLGHKNIQHTVRYTELSPDRFRDFWRD